MGTIYFKNEGGTENMIEVTPQPIIVSTGVGFHHEFLKWLENEKIEWRPSPSISFLENLYEFAGRLCYESWKLEDGSFVNKNLTKIREGNFDYIKNILEVDHGSVLEHGSIVILFHNVSRVFTHELVRHRVGTAMSQTSGRYVRYDNIKFWIPPSIYELGVADHFKDIIAATEDTIRGIYDGLDINNEKNFSIKKKITSAIRRIAPNGLANNILFSFNGRSLRHILKMRTSPQAEEEMQFVMKILQYKMEKEFPSLLQDFIKQSLYCKIL
jgi:thymidylate synthase (FAD)